MKPDYTAGLQLARAKLLEAFKNVDKELSRTCSIRLGDVVISTSQLKSAKGCENSVPIDIRIELHAEDEKSVGQFSGK